MSATQSLAVVPHSPAPAEKRPLTRQIKPATPFPTHHLGGLEQAAQAIAELTQAPMAICANSVLAAATLAIQPHRDVEGPNIGRRPVSGLFISIAESGERKSSVDRLATRVIHDAETTDHRHTLSDATAESIVLFLKRFRFGGQFTAEGGIVIGGHSLRDETKTNTAAIYNTLWDGDTIHRDRAIGEPAFVKDARFCAHLMMQPTVAERLLGDPTLGGIGTLARMLFVAPESTIGTRLFKPAPEDARATLREYENSLNRWLEMPKEERIAMELSNEANAAWITFHDRCERAMGPGGHATEIKGFEAKLPEHALRLAAVLAAFVDVDARTIDEAAMANAIGLAKHYESEFLRLVGNATTAPDLRLAERLLVWWQARHDPTVHLAEIYQRGPAGVRDAATALRVAGILAEHGWVLPVAPDTIIAGAKRKNAWVLAP